MKKVILLLVIVAMAVTEICCTVELTAASNHDETLVQAKDVTYPLSTYMIELNHCLSQNIKSKSAEISAVLAKQNQFRDDIPLTYEEQGYLQRACKEFKVPYALALGLIEKETDFRNIVGDDGESAGYMQVQQKWHWDRMERLGVTDLMDPRGNFRVGLDFLSELYGIYEDWSLALTVYNMGHDPGYITDYANAVMENYAHWQELIELDN